MEKENKPEEVLKICKVCQQSDWFNPTTGYCLRCSNPPKDDNLSIRKFRPQMPRPAGLEVDKFTDSLALKKGWYDKETASFQLVFAFVWNIFLTTSLAIWISDSLAKREIPDISYLMALAPFILIGIFLVYCLAATYRNSTTISVKKDNLSIKHSPLAWPGNRTIPKSELDQLYVVKGSTIKSGGTKIHYYNLKAKLKNGKHTILISALPSKEVALFLEQQIETYMGIVDYIVEGELS
jgi:hypothetical protein